MQNLKMKLFSACVFSIMLLFPVFLGAQNMNMNSSDNGNNSSKVEIYPVKNLTQKLKTDINLTNDQTPKVMSILRQYEADTYEAKGDNEEVNEAKNDAQENIADLLTQTQKNEWQKTKSDWWASVDKQLNLSNLKTRM